MGEFRLGSTFTCLGTSAPEKANCEGPALFLWGHFPSPAAEPFRSGLPTHSQAALEVDPSQTVGLLAAGISVLCTPTPAYAHAHTLSLLLSLSLTSLSSFPLGLEGVTRFHFTAHELWLRAELGHGGPC